MNKSGNMGMWFHQSLSFHPLLMRVPRAEAVFWPGCALMNLDPALLQKTLSVLRRFEPGIRLAAGCCGQPTRYLFPQKEEQRRKRLACSLRKQGVRRIYTACPNCTLQLGELDEFEIIPIWAILAKNMTREDTTQADGTFVWHDPCPTRNDAGQREAARKLLALNGCRVLEPEHTGPKTRCCGNFHMLRATDPEKSAKARRQRVDELLKCGESSTILSSCEGCLDAFRSEGCETRHLLELLFGPSRTRSWGNRIRTTFLAKTGII